MPRRNPNVPRGPFAGGGVPCHHHPTLPAHHKSTTPAHPPIHRAFASQTASFDRRRRLHPPAGRSPSCRSPCTGVRMRMHCVCRVSIRNDGCEPNRPNTSTTTTTTTPTTPNHHTQHEPSHRRALAGAEPQLGGQHLVQRPGQARGLFWGRARRRARARPGLRRDGPEPRAELPPGAFLGLMNRSIEVAVGLGAGWLGCSLTLCWVPSTAHHYTHTTRRTAA